MQTKSCLALFLVLFWIEPIIKSEMKIYERSILNIKFQNFMETTRDKILNYSRRCQSIFLRVQTAVWNSRKIVHT